MAFERRRMFCAPIETTQSPFDPCSPPTSDWILMWWGQQSCLSLWHHHHHHSFDLSGDRPLSRSHRSVFKCFLLLLKWNCWFLSAAFLKVNIKWDCFFVCSIWKMIFPLSFRTELSDHLETIDYGLENLQQILNAQTINFDTSPLFDVNIVWI